MRILSILINVGFLVGAAVGQQAPMAKTKNGTYQGFHLASFDQDLFLGVKYANSLRFAQATSLNTTFSVQMATNYSNSCPGAAPFSTGFTVSEDCLSLNIVRPSSAANGSVPVLVW
jgi:carboxylesterase type B